MLWGLGRGYVVGSIGLVFLPSRDTEADRAFLDFAQVVGTRGRLGATAPRTAGEACRPACAPASPFPTKALPARESWRKDGCAIGRRAIVSGGMFPCTRASVSPFSGGFLNPVAVINERSRVKLLKVCGGAVGPREHETSAVHGLALP